MIFDEGALMAAIATCVRGVVREELARRPTFADQYISVKAAARRIDVAPATIRDWINRGMLGRYHAGRELRVKVSELEALVARDPQTGGDSVVADATPEDMGVRDALRDMRAPRRRRNE